MAEELAKNNSVFVAGLYDIKKDFCEQVNQVNIYRFAKKEKLSFLGKKIERILERIYFYIKIEKLIKKEKIDLVEYPDYMTMFMVKHSIPVVLRIHGSYSWLNLSSKKRTALFSFEWFEKNAMKKADHVIGVSHFALKQANKCLFERSSDNCSIIYNFPNENIFYNKNLAKKNYILFFGTVNSNKGVFSIARASNIFLQEIEDLELWFVGKKSERINSELLSKVKSNLHKKIKILSHLNQEKLAIIINEAKICILPSYLESCPMAHLEAISCGACLISSDRGPMLEIIKDNYNGILVNPNDWEDIAKKVLFLCEDKKLRDTLSQNALLSVEKHFNKKTKVEENMRVYKKIIEEKKND